MRQQYRNLMGGMFAVLALASCNPVVPDVQTLNMSSGETYFGQVEKGRSHGWGVLCKGDSVVYEGEWRNGVRKGWGQMTDSLGRKVEGRWDADMMLEGKRYDLEGIYTGELTNTGVAHGYGRYDYVSGEKYLGLWKNNVRQGFGFACTDAKGLQLGEWVDNKYKGERLTYNADHVYGIDISRFQHEIGNRKYDIDWSKLRIRHLGDISKKKIKGDVDYPVSFCYIKATEGTTITNAYYKNDYANARRHGIKCGAYHFFSTKSDGTAQANYFLKNCNIKSGDLPPVLDVEPSDAQIAEMGGDSIMFFHVRKWLQRVEAQAGVRPVLYVGQNFVNRHLVNAPDLKQKYQVWIARYGEYKPDVHLLFWQLCPDGRVQGITGDVDINIFNGYSGQYDMFLRTNLKP